MSYGFFTPLALSLTLKWTSRGEGHRLGICTTCKETILWHQVSLDGQGGPWCGKMRGSAAWCLPEFMMTWRKSDSNSFPHTSSVWNWLNTLTTGDTGQHSADSLRTESLCIAQVSAVITVSAVTSSSAQQQAPLLGLRTPSRKSLVHNRRTERAPALSSPDQGILNCKQENPAWEVTK